MELSITSVVAGGAGLAREPSGRVVFVDGALPGERVDAELVEERRDYARARLERVVVEAPGRIALSCAAARSGCGGCPWLHVSPDSQRALKRDIVVDALQRLAHVPDPPVEARVGAVSPHAYRSTVRMAVDSSGRLAYHASQSEQLIAPDACQVVHPRLEAVIRQGRFGGAATVTLRLSVASGRILAIVAGGVGVGGIDVPDDVEVTAPHLWARRGPPAFSETAAGRSWRVSAPS